MFLKKRPAEALGLAVASFFAVFGLAGCSKGDSGESLASSGEPGSASIESGSEESEDSVVLPFVGAYGGYNRFSSFLVEDAFAFDATFGSDLGPFLAGGSAGSEVRVTVALLGCGDGYCPEAMLILETAGGTVGFATSFDSFSFGADVSLKFDTRGIFVEDAGTGDAAYYEVVTYSEAGDAVYEFDLAKTADGAVSLSVLSGTAGAEAKTAIASSVAAGSYEIVPPLDTKPLVLAAAIRQRIAAATVASVTADEKLMVASADAPTLKEVSFLAAAYADGSSGGSPLADAVKAGASIYLTYYQRYASYVPVDVFSRAIYVY